MPTFHRGDCLKVRDEFLSEAARRGFAIFWNDVYEAEGNSFVPEDSPLEIVELVENGDWEPCTFYDVRFFERTDQEPYHAPHTLECNATGIRTNLYGPVELTCRR